MYADPLAALQSYESVATDHQTTERSDRFARAVLDALRMALAIRQPGESLVESYQTELIGDRVWRSHAQLELATVDYVAWFNPRRLHSSLATSRPPSTSNDTSPRSLLTLKRCYLPQALSPLKRFRGCTTRSGSSPTYGTRQSP
jgi:transposase InsO family protein